MPVLQAVAETLDPELDSEHALVALGAKIASLGVDDPFRAQQEYLDSLLEKEFADSIIRLEVAPEIGVTGRFGIIDRLTASLDAFVENEGRCLPFSAFPFLDELMLFVTDHRFDEFVKLPILVRFQHIWFYEPYIDDARVAMLLGSRNVTQVRSWNFESCGEVSKQEYAEHLGIMTEEGARRIAASPTMASCESLILGYTEFGVDGFKALAASSFLQRLRTLNCGEGAVGDAGMEVIANATRIASGFVATFASRRPLQKVDVAQNEIDDAALERAMCSGNADNMEWIDLSDNLLTDRGVCAIAGSAQWSRLQVLNLTGNQITYEGSRPLRESPHLNGLKRLYLPGAAISQDERVQLTTRFGDAVILR